MKIYLAGPMRGVRDNNRAAFQRAAEVLRRHGHEVWSPAEQEDDVDAQGNLRDIRAVFQRDLQALLRMDAVVLLPRSAESQGARLERHTADVVGIPCYEFEDPLNWAGLRPRPPRTWS